ncbi:TPA: methionine ABC transporter permease [Pseudomonas putida]|uniref:Binding-protein-dependent transport systems inner membrane component n=1 Tax=Pseudomonas putida (strain GB-1) TaxID=76869 RepID=B0KHG8_PSEPG|nr:MULTISPECIES: methionine ABC transporter permease [Pseudomonas]ABY99050.1 binding-protein-dependent transport systems inner membrane component [Pseudomonas putida GB-1]APE99284.1 metal ABC transporter permease [Pseudomonas putida]MBP0708741.1 ABC transporter permease [Pseudomonas sp. T34]MCE1000965.1 ABC transporter permease [Pseudomonas sp. NMI1173_11]MCK2188179.1 ABC transporter permease [Pseudomonas sp. MB04B]
MNDLLTNVDWAEIAQACLETLSMLGAALGFTVLFGLPLGVLLYLTGQRQLLAHDPLYRTLSVVVNVLRSLPFIILLIVLIPLTTLLTGTSLGVKGTIPPLVVGCTPFFARLVETALREVDRGLVEASQAMGGSIAQIIRYTLLPEARTGLIAAVTVTAIVLVDYTAMAGVIGGGGLGDLAIRFGYQRFQTDVMVVTVLLLILLVQLLQMSGDRLVRHFTRR